MKIGDLVITGKDISITDGQIYVDGVLYSGEQPETKSGILEIRITDGTIENLRTDLNVTARDVAGNIEAGGNVSCGNVKGDVTAGENFSGDVVGGSVNAGGNVNCGRVCGDLTAGGNVRHA